MRYIFLILAIVLTPKTNVMTIGNKDEEADKEFGTLSDFDPIVALTIIGVAVVIKLLVVLLARHMKRNAFFIVLLAIPFLGNSMDKTQVLKPGQQLAMVNPPKNKDNAIGAQRRDSPPPGAANDFKTLTDKSTNGTSSDRYGTRNKQGRTINPETFENWIIFGVIIYALLLLSTMIWIGPKSKIENNIGGYE